MGAIAITAITIANGTVRFGTDKMTGLDCHAWMASTGEVHVSRNGTPANTGIIYNVKNGETTLHTIDGVEYATAATWVVAFNNAILNAAASGDINVDNTSIGTSGTMIGKAASATGADFTTAYAGANTITLSGYPPNALAGFTDDDIEMVRQINLAGAVIATYTRDDATMTLAANVLTVTGAAFTNTDTFVVVTNVPRDTTIPNNDFGYIGKASGTNADFTTAYAGSSTITCSAFPSTMASIGSSDIEVIKQINSLGAVVNVFTKEDTTISVAANVITVSQASFTNTDTFIVYTNIPRTETAINTAYPDTFFSDKVTIGAAQAQVYNVAKAGWITIKAASGNGGDITIGVTGVTADDGYVLEAGEEATMEHDNLSELYAISDGAGRYIYILGSYKA